MARSVAPSSLPADYPALLEALRRRIEQSRVRAAQIVNHELVLLYWHIGRDILQRQGAEGWGAKVIDRLARDLGAAFPDARGFSARSLKYMRAFAEAYPDVEFVQQAVAQIPWGHNLRLLERVPDAAERRWYIAATVEHGWSRNVLTHQIDSGLYARSGKALSNFDRTLPSPQSDLARELVKDPYNFDFLGNEVRERQLEAALLNRLRDFMLELGAGFAFVGSQYHLEVGGEDFYLDLLFYHLHLRAYVIAELKTGMFRPEYTGKMGFYLAAVDDMLRHPEDRPSIGIILCRDRNDVIVEYALRDSVKPISVSRYTTDAQLPTDLRRMLPSAQALETELRRYDDGHADPSARDLSAPDVSKAKAKGKGKRAGD